LCVSLPLPNKWLGRPSRTSFFFLFALVAPLFHGRVGRLLFRVRTFWREQFADLRGALSPSDRLLFGSRLSTLESDFSLSPSSAHRPRFPFPEKGGVFLGAFFLCGGRNPRGHSGLLFLGGGWTTLWVPFPQTSGLTTPLFCCKGRLLERGRPFFRR